MRLRHWLLIVLALVLFVWGAERQGRLVNTDMNTTDQDAYRDYAKKLAQTNYQFVGDRNRMPVYPLLMALFYREGMSDEAYFALGKQVGIGIALLVLGGTFYLFRRYTSPPDAIVATFVAAFTMLVYRAPFFQAEVLFYGLSFALFVLLLELIRRPRWGVAVAAGVIGALAHLTKASILPAIVLCLICLLLRAVGAFGPKRAKEKQAVQWSDVVMPLVCGLLFLLVFLGVLFPYISTSKARFGQYFYNVNSTFYLWYDSWDEVKQGTRAHGDRVGWPDMPAEQIPSMSKYWREHTVRQIVERFGQGLKLIWDMTLASYGYAPFLLFYGLLAGLLFWQNVGRFGREFVTADRIILLVFISAYFGSYLLLYAWYIRIAYGNRFVLALFLPALFVLVWTISYAGRQKLAISFWKSELPATSASLAVLLMLTVYLITIFPSQIATMYGGL
ncbi:MAG: hypothetical protein U0350_33160 [Caldilineaceae bacterium]